MKNILSIIFILLFLSNMKGQNLNDSPSMQVGLGSIKFSRGDLDVKLIADLQKEIKIKLIKNMFLERVGAYNGLFYAYIDQSINNY